MLKLQAELINYTFLFFKTYPCVDGGYLRAIIKHFNFMKVKLLTTNFQ